MSFLKKSLADDGGFVVTWEVPGLTGSTASDQEGDVDIMIIGLYGGSEPKVWHQEAHELLRRGGAVVVLGWPMGDGWSVISPLICQAMKSRDDVVLPAPGLRHPLIPSLGLDDTEHKAPPQRFPEGDIGFSPRATIIAQTSDGRPAVAVQPVEGGYCLAWVGSDWWRRMLWEDGGGLLSWPRLVRWLLSPDSRGRLRLQPGKEHLLAGEPFSVGVEVFSRGWDRADHAHVELLIRDNEGAIQYERSIFMEQRSGPAAVGMPGLGAGRWRVEARAVVSEEDTLRAWKELVVSQSTPEFLSTAPDSAFLARLAREGHGVMLGMSEQTRIDSLISWQAQDIVRHTVPFRRSPLSFILLLCVLGTEWWLRQQKGLA